MLSKLHITTKFLIRGKQNELSVYFKNHTKQISALCGQNAEAFYYYRGGGRCYRSVLNGHAQL
jgi:hypothetical protein